MSAELFERILDRLLKLKLFDREHVSTVKLYNWGEPFLNPEINSILSILKKNGLYADISSNFIAMPEIDKDLLSVISGVIFSLSGFSQESYGRIHGASLYKTLENFEDLYIKIRKASPDTKISISWHRYRFNENELWQAYKYFDRPGIRFLPNVAYLNDLSEMLSFSQGRLAGARQVQAQKDLFLDYIYRELDYHKQRSQEYLCFMKDQLVIDENGQVLLCCGMSSFDREHVLGNILEMSSEEIFRKKSLDPICPICVASGLPRAIGAARSKTLPPGGKRKYFKLWLRCNLADPCLKYLYLNFGAAVKNLPAGGEIFRRIRKMV